jgi:hypothetical protein
MYVLRTALFVTLTLNSSMATAQTCHYQDWRWNVSEKRAVQQKTVEKDYSNLSVEERDDVSGCSVCVEDQRSIRVDGVPEFLVCKKYAQAIQGLLNSLIQQGGKIKSVIGYRVGRTRGNVDVQGNRTGFSNHSYGVAVDINAEHNGMYNNCIQFGPHCQLSRGGPWHPGQDPYSLNKDGPIVMMFKRTGFKWGGEIKGQQKDFMHFSLTGY